jgi:hypothetical protein
MSGSAVRLSQSGQSAFGHDRSVRFAPKDVIHELEVRARMQSFLQCTTVAGSNRSGQLCTERPVCFEGFRTPAHQLHGQSQRVGIRKPSQEHFAEIKKRDRCANSGSDQPAARAVPTYASCPKENPPPSSISGLEKLAVSEAIVLMAV